jgi:hypothetical protein
MERISEILFGSLKNEKSIQGMGVTRGAESQQQKQRAEKTAENALVPGWAALADRMRRPHQRVEASSWIESLSVSRVRRYAALGWPWGDRGQHHPDRSLPGTATSLRSQLPRLGTQTG